MCIQALRRTFLQPRPPSESPLGEPFLTQPKSLAVVDQALQGLATSTGKDKQSAAERIGFELLAAELRQSIDALAEVDRLNRQEDPHLRSDLDHALRLQNACIMATTSSP